ncbi:MAG: hypothetical protein ACK4FB_07955 [Brevundimonas sp.]|uniref:hypothetical protein n=1 Tax=Brevundimonas sp. TaxID=1871086 RepID=UPI003919E9DB
MTAQALQDEITTFVQESPHPAEAWDDAAALTAIGIDIAQTIREGVRKIDRMSNCSIMKPSGYGEMRVTASELVEHVCDGMSGAVRGHKVIRASAMNELEGGYPFFSSDAPERRAVA